MSAPSPPIIKTNCRVFASSIRFYWSTPISSGDSPFSSYTLTCSSISYSNSVPHPVSTLTATPLPSSTTYVFQVFATNSNGLSSPPATFVPYQTGVKPGPPTNISISSIGETNSVLLNWSAPASNGGADIFRYAVWGYFYDSDSNILSNVSSFKGYVYGNQYSRLISIPNRLSNYSFIVRAINSPGWSSDISSNYTVFSFAPTNPIEIPNFLSSLYLWLDSSSRNFFTFSSSNIVSRWIDRSPASNHFALGRGSVSRITDGSISTLSFDGTNDLLLESPISFSTTNSTILFAVAKLTSLSDFRTLFGQDTGDYTVRYYNGLLVGGPGNSTGNQNDWGINTYLVNGSSNTTNTFTYSSYHLLDAYSYSNTNNTSWRVGGWRNDTSRNFIGTIAEIIIYNNPITPFNRQKVQGYLAWKHGIQNRLSFSHPFYSAAPTVSTVFSPVSFPDCLLWFDASDPNATGVSPANGTSISTWSNKAVAGVNNGSAVNTVPTYSTGISSLVFGADSYYTLVYPASLTNETLFVVYNTLDQNSRNFLIGSSSSGGREFFIKSSSNALMGVNSFQAEVTYSQVGSVVNNEFAIGTLQINANNWTIWVNGGSNGATVSNSLSSGPSTRIGNSHWSATAANYFREVISFNRALSTDDRQTVEGYLAWKWGLQSRLPSSHPYKNVNPAVP
jgi:hypothetical protein